MARRPRPRVKRPRRDAAAPIDGVVAPGPRIRVAAFGDSVMWGQGLKRNETFADLITRGVGRENQKPAVLVVNRSRSGAVLLERENQREEFLDTYPALFKSRPSRQRFRDGDDGNAVNLYGEIPASFPTVKWQVDIVPADVGKNIDVALLTGGANDIGFDTVINPREFPGEFIQELDGKIRSITHDDLLAQIRRTRNKCPRALIMVFGYYLPLSYASSEKEIETFFEREANSPVGWWINEQFNFVDVGRLILEAKIRAIWAVGRAYHWMRKAVTTANRSDAIRGPGVLFVPSGMTAENAAFAREPEVHEEYRDPTSDDARRERKDAIPRGKLLDRFRNAIPAIQNAARPKLYRSLLDAIDGPESLIKTLNALVENPNNLTARFEAAKHLSDEVRRIQRALIASFLHPNPAGARRYADNALKRYREHVALAASVREQERPGAETAAAGGPETLNDQLSRYGMRSARSLLADIGHLNVDAFSLIVVTQRTSDRDLAPNMFLIIDTADSDGTAGQRRYQLNFPYRLERTGPVPAQRLIIKKFYPHFEPAVTNRFTIDTANLLRLTDIRAVKIVMGPDELGGQPPGLRYGTKWRPLRVNLEINGVAVLDQTFDNREIGPGEELTLSYPPPRPQGPVITAR